jgi:hypothetical protein
MYLAKFDLKLKAFSKVLAFDGESIQSIKWDKDNKVFYLITVKGVTDILYRYDIANDKVENCTLPVDIIEQIHVAKSGTLYILGRSATVPHNVYQSSDGVEWKQLTNKHVLGLSREDMVEPDMFPIQPLMEWISRLYYSKRSLKMITVIDFLAAWWTASR